MVTSKKGVRRDVPQVPSQDAGEVEGLMTGGRVVSGAGAWLSEKSEGGGSDQLTIVPSPCLCFFPSLSNFFFRFQAHPLPGSLLPSLPHSLTLDANGKTRLAWAWVIDRGWAMWGPEGHGTLMFLGRLFAQSIAPTPL